MDKLNQIKVIVTMIGLDDHTVGGVVVSSLLKNAGIEVVYLGTHQTPDMILQAAIQEDVDAIGISSHASNYSQIEELIDLLREKEMNDVLVICGGNIPKKQISSLKEKGVAEVFTPQSTSKSIVNYIRSHVRNKRHKVEPYSERGKEAGNRNLQKRKEDYDE